MLGVHINKLTHLPTVFSNIEFKTQGVNGRQEEEGVKNGNVERFKNEA